MCHKACNMFASKSPTDRVVLWDARLAVNSVRNPNAIKATTTEKSRNPILKNFNLLKRFR